MLGIASIHSAKPRPYCNPNVMFANLRCSPPALHWQNLSCRELKETGTQDDLRLLQVLVVIFCNIYHEHLLKVNLAIVFKHQLPNNISISPSLLGNLFVKFALPQQSWAWGKHSYQALINKNYRYQYILILRRQGGRSAGGADLGLAGDD